VARRRNPWWIRYLLKSMRIVPARKVAMPAVTMESTSQRKMEMEVAGVSDFSGNVDS
jgi:hypothetical protein